MPKKPVRLLELGIAGMEQESLLPIELDVKDGIDFPTAVRVLFLSPNKDLTTQIQIYSEAFISINHHNAQGHLSSYELAPQYYKTPQYFHGHIYEIKRIKKCHDDLYLYELKFKPLYGLLDKNCDCYPYTDETIPNIVLHTIKRCGVSHVNTQGLKKEYLKLDFIVRYNESALDFSNRLMEEHGIYYWFKHEKAKSILMLEDGPLPSSSFDLPVFHSQGQYGGDVPHINKAKASFGALAKACYSARSYRPKQAKSPGEVKAILNKQKANGSKAQDYHFESRYHLQEPGALSDYQARVEQRKKLDSIDIHAFSNIPNLNAGMQLSIESHCSWLNGYQYIYYLEHHVYDNSQHGHFSTNKHNDKKPQWGYDNVMQLYPADLAYSPKEETAKPRINGTLPAVVVGPAGEKLYTNSQAAIKVQFQYDRHHDFTPDASPWIRVLQPFASQGFGHQFIPRVGQNVSCLFENGVPEKPLVVASFYNSDNLPPFDPKTQSGIKTQSLNASHADQAHMLRFDDTQGKEQFYLKSQGDFNLNVKGCHNKTIKGNSTTTIKQGPLIKNVDGHISIKAKKELLLHVGTSQIKLNSEGAHLIADEIHMDQAMITPLQLPQELHSVDSLADLIKVLDYGHKGAGSNIVESEKLPNSEGATADEDKKAHEVVKEVYPEVEVSVDKLLKEKVTRTIEFIQTESLTITGNFKMDSLQSYMPMSINKEEISIVAKNKIDEFFHGIQINNLSMEKVSISGSSINGNHTVHLTLIENTPEIIQLSAEIDINIISKKIQGWHMAGNVKLTFLVTYERIHDNQSYSMNKFDSILRNFWENQKIAYLSLGILILTEFKLLKSGITISNIKYLGALPAAAYEEDAIDIAVMALGTA